MDEIETHESNVQQVSKFKLFRAKTDAFPDPESFVAKLDLTQQLPPRNEWEPLSVEQWGNLATAHRNTYGMGTAFNILASDLTECGIADGKRMLEAWRLEEVWDTEGETTYETICLARYRRGFAFFSHEEYVLFVFKGFEFN